MPILTPARSARSPARPRWPLYFVTALVGLLPGYTVSAHTTGGTFLLWQFDPAVWLGLILVGAAYIYATGVLEQRDPASITTTQTWCFLGGLIVAFLALQSPIDTFSDNSFWVHMIQHILLISVVPPLLLLGTPGALLRPALRIRGVRSVMRVLTNPGVAWLLATGTFLVWHIPTFYDAAVLDLRIHAVEHLCFLATALLFWWPVFSPVPDELPRLTRANQVLYLAVSCQPNVVLGAVLVFGPTAYYAVYAGANRLANISPLVDQQIGGSIMWVPGNLLYLAIISKLFFDWFNERETTTDGNVNGTIGSDADYRDHEDHEAEVAVAPTASASLEANRETH